MGRFKIIGSLTLVTVVGLASNLGLSVPVSAQDTSTMTLQDAGVSAADQSNIADQFDQPGERQLSNVPDDIGYQLQESERRIDAVFWRGPLTPLHRVWDRGTDHLRTSACLDLGLNYTSIYQRADTTVRGPRDAGDGDFDFFGRWHLLGCANHWPGALVFSSETRHRYSKIAPNNLDTGTVGGAIVGFGEQDFSLVQFYWEQGSFDDGAIFRLGKMDPALIYDGGRYVSSNYAFFSPAFADTLPMALPG